MSDAPKAIIVPTVRHVEAWRLSAEAFVKHGDDRMGSIDWPQVVISLCREWEKSHGYRQPTRP